MGRRSLAKAGRQHGGLESPYRTSGTLPGKHFRPQVIRPQAEAHPAVSGICPSQFSHQLQV